MTREEAIAEIKEYLKAAEIESQKIAFRACLNVIEQIEPKTGRWTYTTHYGKEYRVCSECNAERKHDFSTGWNYCPCCGAKMR